MDDVPALPKLAAVHFCRALSFRCSVAKKFFEKFKQPIHSFYGASECGGICYDQDGTTFEEGFVGTDATRRD